MVKRCSRNMIVVCFVVAVLSIYNVAKGEAYTLEGILQGGTEPLKNAMVTLADALTFAVIETTHSDADGAYSFNAEDGVYHIYITPPAGSDYGETVISDVRVIGKNVTKHVVLNRKTKPVSDRRLISHSSPAKIEEKTTNIANVSENISPGVTPVFSFLLPECFGDMCE